MYLLNPFDTIRKKHKANLQTDLNSEFSFSYTSCHTKVKLPSLPYS